MPIAFVYFDFGKVLCDFSHETMCEQMANVVGKSPEAVRAYLFENEVQWRFEAGEFDTDGFFDMFCTAMENPSVCRKALAEATCDIFSPLVEMRSVIADLAERGHRFGVLSNTNPKHWEFVLANALLPVEASYFDPIVLSYEERSMKPARSIYEAATRRAGVPKEAIFFTDDREENIVGALEYGWDAVLYQNADQLRAALQVRGLLEPTAK